MFVYDYTNLSSPAICLLCDSSNAPALVGGILNFVLTLVLVVPNGWQYFLSVKTNTSLIYLIDSLKFIKYCKRLVQIFQNYDKIANFATKFTSLQILWTI